MSEARIDLLTIDTGRLIGGGQVSVERLLRNLDPVRFRSSLACPRGSALGARLAHSPVAILPWIPPSRGVPRSRIDLLASGATRASLLPIATGVALARLGAWARGRERLVIHGNTFQGGLIGALLARLTDRPLVFHDRILKSHGAIERWLYGQVDRAFAITNGVAAKWREEFVDKIEVLVDGVDHDRFHPRGDRSVRLRTGIPQESVLVLSVSRISEEKGLEILIEAARRLGGPIHIAFVGEPFLPEDRRYLARLESLAVRAAVRAHFLGFLVDVVPAYESADVFVLSSHAEPFGQVVLEAMAMGKPIIAPRSGGPLEMIEEGTTGLFFEPGDPDSLAARLRDLLGDPTLRARLGQNARRAVMQRFAFATTIRQFESTIRMLAERGRRHPACSSGA